MLEDVLERYGLGSSRRQALLLEAARLEDGNRYLRRSELEAAAERIQRGARIETAAAARLRGMCVSVRALEEVCRNYEIDDRLGLLSTALALGGRDRCLSRSELEAAAKRLRARTAGWGVISDVDKTVLPPHVEGEKGLPAPYPGVRALFAALEWADGADDRDVSFVTGRPAAALGGVPAWLGKAGWIPGAIETGRPDWSAPIEEKVRDIEALFEREPERRYVLFGDSSHHDPEVYRAVMERHPERVAAVVIHRVTERVAPERVRGMLLVDDYAQAAKRLYENGLLDRETAREVMVAAQLEGLEITDAELV